MPFRAAGSPLFRILNRQFHNTSIRRNHYETLKVPITASPKDIKKAFYSLSKSHHPDHNPNDPEASSRFVKISEAYAVLGSTEKRSRYDRDVMRTNPPPSSHVPRGSYHSSGPAGGRPASGLSRRKTHFQGPPPSFYRSGGWGDQGAKRQAAQGETASGADSSAGAAAGDGAKAHQGHTEGGMGPGQAPFGHATDVPHFDREGHFRTHTNHERRRQRRTAADYIPATPPPSMLANFFIVGGLVSVAILVPTLMFDRLLNRNRKEDK